MGHGETRVEAVLGRRPGVLSVDANPVGQAATVTFDPTRTSLAELTGWIRDCGFHCRGQSVPDHVCDPLELPATSEGAADPATHPGHDIPVVASALYAEGDQDRWRIVAIQGPPAHVHDLTPGLAAGPNRVLPCSPDRRAVDRYPSGGYGDVLDIGTWYREIEG